MEANYTVEHHQRSFFSLGFAGWLSVLFGLCFCGVLVFIFFFHEPVGADFARMLEEQSTKIWSVIIIFFLTNPVYSFLVYKIGHAIGRFFTPNVVYGNSDSSAGQQKFSWLIIPWILGTFGIFSATLAAWLFSTYYLGLLK